MYADYTYYTNTYHGTAIPDADTFARLSIQAEAYIDLVTGGNIDTTAAYMPAVKNAVCALCDNATATSTADNVASESVGNHSISYRASSRAETAAQKTAIVSLYLGSTGLLYRGLK